jgi:hypothetical protein
MTAYQTAVENLANAARILIQLGSVETDTAIRFVAENAVREARNAASRTGIWASESTTEQIDAALFAGAVARDALDGNSRPSVGNVFDAIKARVAPEPD